MMREALPSQSATNQSAKFSLLQLALPAKPILNIGILLFDPTQNRLYKKLRRDWSAIADPANAEVLEHIDDDLEAKIEEMGGDGFLRSLEESLSNTLRITDRRDVEVSDFPTALNRLFEEHVQRTEVIPFVTHVPLYSLRAAATRFGEDIEVEAQGWVPAPQRLKLNRNMFAARVVGRSMQPLIPDGSLCLFRAGVVGSRQGKRLLIQRMGATDSSAEFTVKVYTSKKAPAGDDQWRHIAITLQPLNPEFEAMNFGPEDEQKQFRVIAEFMQVLEEPL
jgi:phage repressor protein C with HTH and peptisase S24 domain